MNTKSSINRRAGFQFLLLVAVVFCIGFYYRNKDNHRPEQADNTHIGLYASSTYADSCPDVSLCSDENWKSYRASHSNDAGVVAVVGNGHINKMDVSVDCLLFPDGTIVGRYANNSGITLDVNGYVESGTGDLKIRLGHESTSTLSNWYLHLIKDESNTDSYVYEGEWGKKKLSSRMIFKRITENG